MKESNDWADKKAEEIGISLFQHIGRYPEIAIILRQIRRNTLMDAAAMIEGHVVTDGNNGKYLARAKIKCETMNFIAKSIRALADKEPT